jgi:hypothetical protein
MKELVGRKKCPGRRKTRTVPHVVQANLLRAADLESASAASPITDKGAELSRKEEVPRNGKEGSSYCAPCCRASLLRAADRNLVSSRCPCNNHLEHALCERRANKVVAHVAVTLQATESSKSNPGR